MRQSVYARFLGSTTLASGKYTWILTAVSLGQPAFLKQLDPRTSLVHRETQNWCAGQVSPLHTREPSTGNQQGQALNHALNGGMGNRADPLASK